MSNVRLLTILLAAAVSAGCGETDTAAGTPPVQTRPVSQPAPKPVKRKSQQPAALPAPAEITMKMRSLLFLGDPEQAALPADETEARTVARNEIERAQGTGYGAYHAWRRARSIGIKPGVRVSRDILGVVTEIGYPHGLLLVVGWRDGGASLYLGHGGGMIGGHGHETVRRAAKALTELAEGYVVQGQMRETFPLPRKGEVLFTLLTPEGPVGIHTTIKQLRAGNSVLTPLYKASHEVITQFRLIDEKRKKDN